MQGPLDSHIEQFVSLSHTWSLEECVKQSLDSGLNHIFNIDISEVFFYSVQSLSSPKGLGTLGFKATQPWTLPL